MSDLQIKYWDVIELLMLEGQTVAQIHDRMLIIYGE